MGDAAEAILNGDDCQECGEYIGDGEGFPRSCDGCESDHGGAAIYDPPERSILRLTPASAVKETDQ